MSLYKEIINLGFNKEERNELLIHFTRHPEQGTEVASVLEFFAEDEKIMYLKEFLKFSQRFNQNERRNMGGKKIEKKKGPRYFTTTGRPYQDINYYIEPTEIVEKLGKFLLDGEFCLLYGHDRSGKTTTSYAVSDWLIKNSNKEVYIISFGVTVVDKGLEEFWESVCFETQHYNQERFSFNYNSRKEISSATFINFFLKTDDPLVKGTIIIIDDAEFIFSNDNIINDFINALKVLKGVQNSPSFLLIGTEIIRELVSYQQSPFSNETSLMSTRFTLREIMKLLDQYASENKIELDQKNIAMDIYSLTFGHKGLVGTCCLFLEKIVNEMDKSKLTYDDWIRETYKLPQFVRNQYRNIIQAFHNLSSNQKHIIESVLNNGCLITFCNDDVKFLLAEGMVIIEKLLDNGKTIIRFAAPILRNIMLYEVCEPNIKLFKELKLLSKKLDIELVLEHTIRSMSSLYKFHDIELSEYIHQAEFTGILKHLVSSLYSDRYSVIAEIREFIDDNSNYHQQLNIFIEHVKHDLKPNCGFRLIVNANGSKIDECSEDFKKYAEFYDCPMFIVNLCTTESFTDYFGPYYFNVNTVHVICLKEMCELVYRNRNKEVLMQNI